MAAVANIEVRAQVDNAVRGLEGINKSFDAMKRVNQDAAGALGVFGVSLSSLNNPMTALAGATKTVIDDTVQYAKEVRNLARDMGVSTEEASVMLNVADDLQVSYDTLKLAAREMNKDGIQPTFANLKKLAKEYQDIKDPVEQAKFAQDHFGKSSSEVRKLLEANIQTLDESASAAKAAGLVMSEDAAQGALEYEQALDNLGDTVKGIEIAIGGPLVKGLTKAADGAMNAAKLFSVLNIVYQEHLGIIDHVEAESRAAQVAQGNIIAGWTRETGAIRDVDKEYEEHREQLQAVTSALPKFTTNAENYSYAVGDIQRALDGAKHAAQDFGVGLGDLNTIMSGPVAQADEDYYQQQKDLGEQIAATKAEIDKLKKSQGAFIPSTINAAEVTDNLTIAQYNQQKSAAALAEAQKKLAENTDPEKVLELQAAVARANQSYGDAVGAVGEWNAKLDEAGQVHIVDHQAKIGELQGTLGELNAAYDANARAHEEATARIVFGFLQQKLGADGWQEGELGYLAEVGKAWGIYDESTAKVLGNVDAAIKTSHGDAQAFVDYMNNNVYNLPDKTVRINVETHYQSFGSEPGPASGSTGVAGTSEDSSSNTGGMRQFGGPVAAGRGYVVGESGIESFWPAQNGFVMDNQDTMQIINLLQQIAGGGMGAPVNVYLDGALIAQAVSRNVGRGVDARQRMGIR